MKKRKDQIEKCVESSSDNYKYEIKRNIINDNIILELEIKYEFVNMKEEIILEKMNKNDIKNMYIKSEIRIEELEKKNIKLEEMVEGLEERIEELENKNIKLEERINERIKKYLENKNIYLSRKDNNYYIFVNNIYYKFMRSSYTDQFASEWKNENKSMMNDNNLNLIIEFLLNNKYIYYFTNQFTKVTEKKNMLFEEISEYLKKNNNELLERIKKEIPEIKILNI